MSQTLAAVQTWLQGGCSETQQTTEVKLPEIAGSSAGGHGPQEPLLNKSLFSPWGSQGKEKVGRAYSMLFFFSSDADSEQIHNWRSVRTYLYHIFKESIPQLNFREQEVNSTKVVGVVHTLFYWCILKNWKVLDHFWLLFKKIQALATSGPPSPTTSKVGTERSLPLQMENLLISEPQFIILEEKNPLVTQLSSKQ